MAPRKEDSLIGYLLIRDNINDTSGRSICGEFDWLIRALVVNIETEHIQDILSDSEVGVPTNVEHDVKGFEGSGGRGIDSDGLGIDAELSRENLDLSFGRYGVEGGPTQQSEQLRVRHL